MSKIKNVERNFGFSGVAYSSKSMPFLGASDGQIYQWESNTIPQPASTQSGSKHKEMISCITICRPTPQDEMLLTGGADRQIKQFRIVAGTKLEFLRAFNI